jgi:hypothetical protein
MEFKSRSINRQIEGKPKGREEKRRKKQARGMK